MSITDEEVAAVAATARPYSLVQLRWTAERYQDGAATTEREHQRRILSLRADGTIAVLCPVLDDSLAGVAIMVEPPDEARRIMADDPCIRAGMMTCEVVPCLGFPGDALPG